MPARSTRERLFGTLVSLLIVGGIGWSATQGTRTETRLSAASLAALEQTGVRAARVQIDDGAATVFGRADDSRQRDAALRAVGRIDGMRTVTDRLEVSTPADPVADASPEPLLDAPTLVPPEPTPARPIVKKSASPTPARSPGVPEPAAVPTRASADNTDPCSVPTSLRGQAILFENVSATVQGTSVNLLAAVASHLRDCPANLLEVRAYADQAGSPQANMALSRQRAQAVKGHIAQQGISADRLVATYKGHQSPGGNKALVTIHTGGTP